MFKSFSEVSTKIVDSFLNNVAEIEGNKNNINRGDIKQIILVELAVYGFVKNFGIEKASVENVWSIFPNYKEVYETSNYEKMLDILRIYFGSTYSLSSWKYLVDKYMSFESFLRQYRVNDKGYFIEKNCSFIPERISHYEHLLEPETIQSKEKEFPPFLPSCENVYYENIDTKKKSKKMYVLSQDKDGFKRAIPSHLLQEEELLIKECKKLSLPKKRQKLTQDTLSLPLSEQPWLKTALQMDEYIQKNIHTFSDDEKDRLRDWSTAQNGFKLKSTNQMIKELTYKDKVNIAGIVGAGKSTFLLMELFRLKNLNAKTAVMTVNVADTLDLVYRLHLIGLKAVPLIGKKNLALHLKNFIKKVKNEANRDSEKNPLSQLSLQYVLQFFSGSCTIEILANAEEGLFPPCISLKKNDDKFSCPLFLTCGKYQVDRLLADADVWVGTQSAFIHTKPNVLVNPYDLTYAEIAYEDMDVIFVDEADSVQESVDGSFLAQNILFGNKEAIFESSFLEARNSLDTRYDFSTSKVSKEWRYHATQSSKVAHYIYELIQESIYVRKELKNKAFGHHQLISKLTKALFNPTSLVTHHEFYKQLIEIDFKKLSDLELKKNAFFEKVVIQYMLDLEETKIYSHSIHDQMKNELKLTFQVLESFIKKLDLADSSELNNLIEIEKNNLMMLFQFYLLLIYFDFHFKYLMKIKNQVEDILGEEIPEISSIFQNVKRFLPFMPQAATGRSFQYFYKESLDNQEGSVGTFRTYDYLAIGRYFLVNFSTLFENVLGKKGPTMVFLSGTSYSEGSKHYHLDINLDYLLEATNSKTSKINQECYPVYENGSPIFISGERNERVKQHKLRLMANQLVPKIKSELASWTSEGRKVLMVVNSYDQAMVVLEELRMHFPGKVKALTREGTLNNDYILRGEVEFFSSTEADILIAPLMSINRGYNILIQGSNKSLFGSVFFMIRPYIPSGEIDNVIKVINGTVPSFIATAKNKHNYSFYEAVNYIRKRSNLLLDYMLAEDESDWTYLQQEEQENMAWYMFINVWQMIGRLLRGQTDANVFYVDAPFAWENANQTGKRETFQTSMLRLWITILERDSGTSDAKKILFGEFLNGLKKALKLDNMEVF
jgi:hypothetical protein